MNERSMQFRVGVTILAAILVAFILVAIFVGTNPLLRSTYPIYIKFSEAPGVSPGTPVRMAGIRIGQVRDVQLAKDETGVIVTADIGRDRRLYNDELCKVTSPVLMGDTSLEFVKNPNFNGPRAEIKPDEVLPGYAAPEVTGSIAGMQRQAAETLDTLNTAGRNIDKLASRVDRLVETNEKGITGMIGEARETMELLRKTLNDSNKFLGDPQLQEQLRLAIGKMPDTLEKTRSAAERVEKTFASLDNDMKDIAGLTKALGKYGPDAVEEFDKTMNNVQGFSANLLQLTQALNDPKNSLGALLQDKELYQHVTHVAKNVDELSRDLKPILNNVAIFTDKIARHPGDLGVRGALKKDTGLKDGLSNDDCETEIPEHGRWPIGGSGQWSLGR